MADETQTAPVLDPLAEAQKLLAWAQPQRQAEPQGQGRTILGLLGEGLGGGPSGGVPMNDRAAESAGLQALMGFGNNLMSAGGWHQGKYTPGQMVAGAMDAARQQYTGSEAVTAARQAAQQEYDQQQVGNRLGALGEVGKLQQLQLALMKLQALQKAGKNLTPYINIGADGTPQPGNTQIGKIGGDGTYEGAIGGFEGTGKNPASSATGTGQFIDGTYLAFAKANPQLFAGMDDKAILATRSDPKLGPALGKAAIGWYAQSNAPALQDAGVTPSGQSLGMAHYLGPAGAAGVMKAPDDAPVANYVSQKALDANPELGKLTAGQLRQRYAGTPDPAFLKPAAQGAPSPAPAPAAPGAAPTQGDAVPGGNQFSGPGAPPGGPLPPMPGGPAAAATIARGMVGAGADPATLAPGAVPGAPGTAVAANVPTAPPAPPGSYEEYSQKYPIPAPPSEIAKTFETRPQADALRLLNEDGQKAHDQQQIALAVGDKEAADKAADSERTARTAAQKLIQDAAEKGNTARNNYFEKQDAARRAAWQKEQDAQTAETLAENNNRREVAKSKEIAFNTAEQGRFDAVEKEGTDARHSANLLQAYLDMSRAARDKSGLLTDDMRGWLMRNKIATPEQAQKWSQQDALEAMHQQLMGSIRSSFGFSRVTNMDLAFLDKAAAGGAWTPEQSRQAKAAFAIAAVNRQARFAQEVANNRSNGMTSAKAMEAADKELGPIIKQVPSDAKLVDMYPEAGGNPKMAWKQWNQENLQPGEAYKHQDGKRLGIYRPVPD